MIELAALVVLAALAFAVLAAGMILLKAILWLVLLPLRVVFKIVFFPLFLIKTLVGGLLLLTLGPILALVLLLGAVAVGVALIAPFLPLVALAFAIWLIVRATSKTTAMATRP